MNIAQRKIMQILLDLVFYETSHARDGMLLSQEADRLVERHPVAGRLFIVCVGAIITLHLANLVDERYDLMAKKFWKRAKWLQEPIENS